MEFSRQRFEAALRVVQLCDDVIFASHNIDLHIFDKLRSTNQTTWDLFAASRRTTVIAIEQTAGRGQWGRQWLSPPGGLYLSVALEPDLPSANAAQLTLCTALGIATALRAIPGKLSGVEQALPIQIKWLNDLILHGRKLGGILTETRMQQEQITKAVVGVGINWANPVPETGINLRSLLEHQPTPLIESLEMLAAITLHGILSGYQRWQQAGIDALLPDYIDLMAGRDRAIVLDGHLGRIVGVTPTGDLRFQVQSTNLTASSQFASSSEILFKPGTINLGYEAMEPDCSN